jgi:UTP--glucose-1-phosphate uridylyltransferase
MAEVNPRSRTTCMENMKSINPISCPRFWSKALASVFLSLLFLALTATIDTGLNTEEIWRGSYERLKGRPARSKRNVHSELAKAVIPVAGLGTRMLPFTKELPKEMLPIYAKCNSDHVAVKPIVQVIFEQLYDTGFREFCFIVGRGKRVIEDHFSVNHSLKNLVPGKAFETADINTFYEKVDHSRISWINQARPEGFGHAVLLSEYFSGHSDFLVHAGDVSIFSPDKTTILGRVRNFYGDYDMDIVLVVKGISNIQSLKQHGVIVPGLKYGDGFRVKGVIEKPANPPSNLAIMPIYIFKPTIFEALERTPVDGRKELQLTDAIQTVIDNGGNVCALMMREDDIRLDIGTPENYLESVLLSYSSQIHLAVEG